MSKDGDSCCRRACRGVHEEKTPEDTAADAREFAEIIMLFDGDGSDGTLSILPEDTPPDLGSAHRDLLHEALERNTSITSLIIGDVSSTCARLLAEALQGLNRIVEVRFTGARADDALAKLLGVLLQPVWVHASMLHTLVIANPRRNMVTDAGAIAIAQALEENRCLRRLVLFGTRMGDGAAAALSAALRNNDTLEVLVLYGKTLTGKGVSAIADLLRNSKTIGLRELVIGGTGFDGRDVKVLAQSAALHKEHRTGTLETFGVLSALLDDASVDALTDLLFIGFKELTLLAGNLSDRGVMDLVDALENSDLVGPTAKAGPRVVSRLALASAVAGEQGLAAIRDMVARGGGLRPLPRLELAFGGLADSFVANEPTLAKLQLSPGVRPNPASVTNNFASFLEEVLFPRIFLRQGADSEHGHYGSRS